MAAITIDISDDEDVPTAKSLGKRKLDAAVEEKVEWTDDSDDGYEKLKTRKPKRRSTAKSKGKAAASTAAKAKRRSSTKDLEYYVKDVDESEVQDELAEAEIPDYLRQRRRQFDEGRQTLREAGLRLPPDFLDIEFSDDERLSDLEERPRFDKKSGVKPSRPYKDIELEYSAGLVPASIAQYLRDYQIAGVKFLHQKFVYQKGAILGDDMGLGKTVQVAAFLTAAFGKTGDQRDAKRMRKMRRAGEQWYPRVLIVCPGSLIMNWKQELARWGWWHVDLFHGAGKDDVLQAAKAGRLEIMITTYATYKQHRDAINSVPWDCVVADECHVMKDRKSETTKAMDEVNALCRLGLTGTAIQNRYSELWTLLNWTNPGHFGTAAEWKQTITTPLTVGQSHDATLHQLSLSRKTAKKLVQNLLPEYFLRRMKTLIAHQLPKKSDKVVFCHLTDKQKAAYENFLESPQVVLINSISEPCDCGSEKKRGWCCHGHLEDGRAWFALVFPSIMTLQKIANHLTLLIPSTAEQPGDKLNSELKALQICFPDDWKVMYRNRESMVSQMDPDFCGKWKVLKKLLKFWHENGDKVLVFSHSVRLLRILQHLFQNTSYSVSFLDGSLDYEERQKVVDDFNSDPAQFVFLISTKAGGVGLNITSANKVVIFDPHWNPSYDLQAQDRAYRIGQTRDVDVFRLVSRGTIEEIIYARQIYKQQQANIGYNASNERRYFKGVQQDSNRKGEIFGLNNLFSFRTDDHVLREIVNKTNIAEAKAGVHLAEVDIEKVAKDEDNELNLIKQEDAEKDDAVSQLSQLLAAENKEQLLEAKKASKPKSDAIAAILAAAGVEYTHENSEVIGSSKVEAQLSRRAELHAGNDDSEDPEGDSALFADSQANIVAHQKGSGKQYHAQFNPPVEARRRQFCSMAQDFGFHNPTDFALVVEGWTQEQRRNCLDTFYKNRKAKLLEEELAERLKEEKMEVKREATDESEAVVTLRDIKKHDDGSGHEKKPLAGLPGDLEQLIDAKPKGDMEDSKVDVKLEPPPAGIAEALTPMMDEERKVTTIFLSDDEDDEL